MNKILTLSLISTFPLTISLNQANTTIKSKRLIRGDWLESNNPESAGLNSSESKLKETKNLLYSNNQIDISLTKNQISQTIAQIYAKKPQKNYYLSLENDVLYDNHALTNFIKNKFYRDKTNEYFLSSDDYFAFFDTSEDNEGKIIENGKVNFRSSWGVRNWATANSRFMFNLQENTLKRHIILKEKEKWGKINLKNIEILKIQPTKFGLFPFVRIFETPIANATWTTKKMHFNDMGNNYIRYLNVENKLVLPEGHDSGQEWWNWFSSVGKTLFSIATTAFGLYNFFTGNFMAGVFSLVIGIYLLVDDIINKIKGDKTNEPLILDKIKDVNTVYNSIMEYGFELSNSPNIVFDNLQNHFLSTYFEGELFGEGWSTAFFGQNSSMDLFTIWGAMNANVSYLVYS